MVGTIGEKKMEVSTRVPYRCYAIERPKGRTANAAEDGRAAVAHELEKRSGGIGETVRERSIEDEAVRMKTAVTLVVEVADLGCSLVSFSSRAGGGVMAMKVAVSKCPQLM